MKNFATLTSVENGAQLSINHSADFSYVEAALKSHWPTLIDLANKIQDFSPKPIEEFSLERQARLEFFKRCAAPEMTESQVVDFVNKQIELLARDDFQYSTAFNGVVATEYVTICMLSQALCEALVNYYLAIGLTKSKKAVTFAKLERRPFLEKWTKQLATLWPHYELPEASELYATLVKLVSQRNALIHGKISLSASNGESICSEEFKREDFHEEINWMVRFMNLPFDLAEHVRLVASDPTFFFILHNRHPIEKTCGLLAPTEDAASTDISTRT